MGHVSQAKRFLRDPVHGPMRRVGAAVPLQVAACVVRDPQGRVLMARRRADQASAGFWEIPGGKVEPGEGLAQAALRELREETGIVARDPQPLITHLHDFPSRRIVLSVFDAGRWAGTPAGHEGQALAWVDPGAPEIGPILPSNIRVLARLALPRVVGMITPPLADPALWARTRIAEAHAQGAQALFLNDRLLPGPQRAALLRRLGRLWGGALWQFADGTGGGSVRFAPAFRQLPGSGAPATSRDPLRGAVLNAAAAAAPGALSGLDVVVVSEPASGWNTPPALQGLAQILQQARCAVYAVVDPRAPAIDALCAQGLQGICMAHPARGQGAGKVPA